MDVGNTDTGQHQESTGSSPLLTVMTAGVNEPLPQNTTKKKGEVGDEEEMEEGSGDFPPSVTMPPPEGGAGDLLDDEGSNNSSASDVETFNGKIVYNADGSAYIIEGVDSELSDDEYGGRDLLPALPAGSSRVSPRPAAPAETQPQLVNALHIARHPALFSAMCGQALNNFLRDNHKVPEIPVMHSYRVFTVKERTDAASCPPSAAAPSSSSADANSYSVWDCGTVPVKPILMCFICRLSFGFTKSFVAHATGEHSLSLNDAEKELVSRKNISAVIQGVSAEPLLSFLEPIPPTSTAPVPSSAQTTVGSVPAPTHGSVSSSSSLVVQATRQHDDSKAAVTTVVSSSACPVPSVTPAADFSAAAPGNGESALLAATSSSSTFNSSTSSYGDNSLVPELEDLANIEKMAEAAVAAAAAAVTVSVPEAPSKSSPPPPVSNGVYDPGNLALSPPRGSSNHLLHHPTTSPMALGLLEDSADTSPKSSVSSQNSTAAKSPSPVLASSMSSSACAHHPEGKANGVECPKCDMILGSSRSLGGHMTMMHSRNSCKTLKCPKCNWHYKYQETLEIHMKEKHPENEMTCLYCVTNQPHPRLARGETYTCGYKPYRCEVCNYSTTTKGNLSIHMQSDKHINNVQELQSNNLAQEHIVALAQQQQQQQPQQQPPSGQSPVGLSVPSSNPASDVLKKAQLTPKPKANWRCDVCNYETNVARNLRIHMTSEKHTHNMMVIQQNMKHIHHLSAMQQARMDPVFQFHPGLLMPADAQLQPEAAIADMAYNHALLMMASQQQQHQQQQQQQHQQQQQQQQRVMAAAAAAAAKSHHLGSASGPLNLSCPPPQLDVEDTNQKPEIPYEDSYKLFQCCVCTVFTSDSLEALSQHVQLDRSRLREEEVLTVVAGTSICKLCTYKTNLKANFQLHCKTDKHLQRLHHVNHVKEGGPRNEWKLKYVNVSNPIQVRCNSCEFFSNSLHKLQLHTTSQKHEISGRLFLFLERSESLVRTESKSYQCTVCNVSVRTKVNLIQHANTMLHLRTLQAHMQGEEPDMREVFVVKEAKQSYTDSSKSIEDEKDLNNGDNGSDIQLMSDEQTKEESKNSRPSDSSMLKQALLDRSGTSSTENGTTEPATHTCPFCNFTSSSEVRIQMHVVSQHSHKPSTLACPLCQDGFREWGVLENHLMDTHHVNKEGVKRLLALVDKTEWMAEKESSTKQTTSEEVPVKVEVKAEAMPKTTLTNGPTEAATDLSMSNDRNEPEEPVDVKQELPELDCRSDSSDSKDDDDFTCAACGRVFAQVEDLFCHQNEMGHLEYKNTGKGGGFFCWKKGCGLHFPTMTSTQFHFKEMHAIKLNAPVSERHVYKYRCTQCSLAFKTSEKLKIHMQYHLIRAATKCVLCGKSFRTVLALQKHVDISHADMTKEQLQQYHASLTNNPLLAGNGSTSGGILDPQTTELLKKETIRDELDDESLPDDMDIMDEPMDEGSENKEQQVLEDYINSQAIAEDSYTDPNRKYKCHRCKVAFTRQSYLTSHNKTLLHRKGEKMSYPMEKYLDPNRPFKCEVCKESFTQKNILLVHYNSVSHLHKLKLSMKDNIAPVTTTTSCTGVSSPASPTLASNSSATPSNTSVTTSNAGSPAISNSLGPAADNEKKPYKCNLCKLSYSQASTLDIHVRSVLHQSKASRIQELVLSGELDLSTPLVERPDSNPSCEQPLPKTNENVSNQNDAQLPTPTSGVSLKTTDSTNTPSTATSSAAITPVTSTPQFSFPLHPDHNNIMQQALNLMQPSMMSGQAPPFQCSRCGSMCSSHDALMQHQQLYCFFAQTPLPPLMSAAPTTPQAPIQLPNLSQQVKQQQQPEREEAQEKQQPRLPMGASDAASTTMQMNLSGVQRAPTPGQQMFKSRYPFLRPKPLIFRHLLESFGFDVVMQFNENSQRRHKKEHEKKEDPQQQKEISPLEKPDLESKDSKKKMDLPEINRSVCHKCGKDFSSIWVLKAHQEEAHKDIVPIRKVEKFAEEFRDDYERRNATVIDDAEAPSPSSSGELASSGPSSTPATPSGATPLSLPAAATPPVTTLGSQVPDMASSVTANHMAAAQMQFNQLLMSMGLGMGLPMGMGMGMNLPFAAAMNMHPPLIPLMMPPPPMDPLMASAFGHPMMPGAAVDPNFFAAQQKMLQQQQLSQQQKRARTRINDDQLKILRAYFDINNSPTEDQLLEMSEKSGLPLKVIKHWFRNTLFKERQRNKDSPYNFNNPPSTFLNLEEYEKTGETKITSIVTDSAKVNGQQQQQQKAPDTNLPEPITKKEPQQSAQNNNDLGEKNDDFADMCIKDVKMERLPNNECPKSEASQQSTPKRPDNNLSYNSCMTSTAQEMLAMSEAMSCGMSGTPTSSAMMSMDLRTSLVDSFSNNYNSNPFSGVSSSMLSFMPPGSVSPPTSESPHSTGTPSGTPTPSCSSSGKRANRTRFTDYQIKVLQEFFETNAYPKDDDLEYLSKLLNLSPRVIVVWFQNARQKARKVYENQPPITAEEESAGRFQRTPGLNYQCKKCLQVFQRYYELIKHQKSSCFKDENPLAGQIKVMSGDERSSQPPTPTLPAQIVQRPAEKISTPVTSSSQNGTYRCDKCSMAFSRFELWREHQLVHMMNPTLFPSYQPPSFPVLSQYDSPSTPNSLQLSQMKRKMSDDEESQSEHPRDKRLRTTILPEQLDYLYQQYQIESNPSRKMLENIAREVGLKKRVVQVWFQNTRARERKGQFRAHQQVIHKRCPFCRALFKARSALESHLATRHADQYTKGDINIDALPDGEGDSNPEDPESPSEDKGPSGNTFPVSASDMMNSNQLKRYYEDSLRKLLDERLGTVAKTKEQQQAADFTMVKTPEQQPPHHHSKQPLLSSQDSPTKESPLDLSKPLMKTLMEKSNGSLAEKFFLDDGTSRGGLMDDAHSETYSESTDNMDGEESNPTSPSSRYSSSSNKRFRTQMTTIQLKVMKSIFVDYKTPSMCECESLGKEIGLPKRVVQVWFQNARAKEKKARLAFLKTFGHEMEPPKVSDECTLCNVKYNIKFSPSTLQEHIFSRKHIENLKSHIDSLKKLTDGQDSDTGLSFDSSAAPNHVANCSNSAALSMVTAKQQTPSSSSNVSGLSGGLPSFANANSNTDKTKSDLSKKETLANGELGPAAKDKQTDDKEENFMHAQDAQNVNDFVPPTTSTDSTTPSSTAGLFPYMYAPFPGYYSGVPGTFLHHAMYPGRTKL